MSRFVSLIVLNKVNRSEQESSAYSSRVMSSAECVLKPIMRCLTNLLKSVRFVKAFGILISNWSETNSMKASIEISSESFETSG